MLVALAVIVEVVAVRMQNMEVGLRPCERDVEQSPLLFDLGVRFGGQIGRDVAVGRVQDEYRLPFEAPVSNVGQFAKVFVVLGVSSL